MQVGLAAGHSPLALTLSPQPAISCDLGMLRQMLQAGNVGSIPRRTATASTQRHFTQQHLPDSLNSSSISGHRLTSSLLFPAVPSVSFVSHPFLHIPNPEEGLVPAGRWFAFYEMKNLKRYTSEIGVSVSDDGGDAWTFLHTALSAPFTLAYPWVGYEPSTQQYVMIPDTSHSKEAGVQVRFVWMEIKAHV